MHIVTLSLSSLKTAWKRERCKHLLEAFGCGLAVAVAIGLLGCWGNICPIGLVEFDAG